MNGYKLFRWEKEDTISFTNLFMELHAKGYITGTEVKISKTTEKGKRLIVDPSYSELSSWYQEILPEITNFLSQLQSHPPTQEKIIPFLQRIKQLWRES